MGTFGGLDYYGFVAEQVASVKVGRNSLSLQANAHNDALGLGITGDVYVNEV
jgi:hypothetical protein